MNKRHPTPYSLTRLSFHTCGTDQENVDDPTEQWETGKPTASAEALRVARYTNARTQMTSNFAPQKRLTLERKSPVVRMDMRYTKDVVVARSVIRFNTSLA